MRLITKIAGSFIAESISQTGYVTEDKEVFLILKGVPMNKVEFEKKVLSILGFTVTTEAVEKYNNIYDNAANEYFDKEGSIESLKLVEDGHTIPLEDDKVGDVLPEKEVVESVIETPKRSRRQSTRTTKK